MRGKKFKPRTKIQEPRINGKVSAPRLRVIIGEDAPIIMEREQALKTAGQMGLDLVEVSANQDPPICRIVDYGKYKFTQKKRKQEQLRNQHTVTIKEIKFRPKIASNDYELKKRNAAEFLEQGNKVKVTLRFRGREITHPEQGMLVMNRLKEDLKEESNIETPARHEGRQIQMVLAPRAKSHPKKSKKELVKKEESSHSSPSA